jgi:hypothetical protein
MIMMAVFGLRIPFRLSKILGKESVQSVQYHLHQAYLLNPKFINDSQGYNVSTKLSFSKTMGIRDFIYQ